MPDETTIGREPIQIVELEQPLCTLTYGVGLCTAVLGVTGDRKCFNTRATTQDSDAYDPADTIKWRFGKSMAVMPRDLFEQSAPSPGVITSTNIIPSLQTVSTTPTRINVGGGREGDSPFGQRARVQITLKDHPWDDSTGDKYLSERTYDPLEQGEFWSKWKARNPFHTNLRVTIYEGYIGQTLGQMRSRLYLLERVDGPDASGRVVLVAKDPLRLADEKRAVFPAVTDMTLLDAVDDTQTTGIIAVGAVSDLTDDFGNTGSTRYIRVGDEIISYTGSSGGPTEHTLTGAVRGELGTTAAAHTAEDQLQRVGRFEDLECWTVAFQLLTDHTPLPNSFITEAEWDAEGSRFLPGFTVSGTVVSPTPVAKLIGELTEQCIFYIWWDEREQKVDMKAVRPPFDDPITSINDELHVIKNSFQIREDPQVRISRIFLYYQVRDPTKSLSDIGNFRSVRGRFDGDAESADQYGEVRNRSIFSRWLQSAAQAINTTVILLSRYRDTPRYVRISLDAKDRDLWSADVIELTTRGIVDDTGAEEAQLWQVIAAEEAIPGEVLRYDLQQYQFGQLFSVWMADPAPDYSAATAAEKLNGLWWGDATGKVGGGVDPGYNWS